MDGTAPWQAGTLADVVVHIHPPPHEAFDRCQSLTCCQISVLRGAHLSASHGGRSSNSSLPGPENRQHSAASEPRQRFDQGSEVPLHRSTHIVLCPFWIVVGRCDFSLLFFAFVFLSLSLFFFFFSFLFSSQWRNLDSGSTILIRLDSVISVDEVLCK